MKSWVFPFFKNTKSNLTGDLAGNGVPLKTSTLSMNIGSYSARVEINIRWGELWDLFAKVDGLADGDQVLKIIRSYQENGFRPSDKVYFHKPFYRKVFEDLTSGLKLQFDDQGRQVEPTRVNQGWLLYDDSKDCPIEDSESPFASSYFSLGWDEFKIDQMKIDRQSIAQVPKPVKNYVQTIYGSSLFQFIRALVKLENENIYASQTPFLAIPSALVEKLKRDGIRYVVEETAWRKKPPLEFDGFEFGQCDGWLGHRLESDFLDFFIAVEGFTPQHYLLEKMP